MKAFAIPSYGKQSKLELIEVPTPAVGENDLLVEIHAASVNPIDFKTRNGDVKILLKHPMPLILGNDFAGVVKQAGAAVKDFRVGDRVYGRPRHDRSGTFAEYIAIDESEVALMPKGMSFNDAASIPLVGLTAYQALHDRLTLPPGSKVLIQAGAGGVGSLAIQLAKQMGLHVATTASDRNRELVERLGADEVVNYRTERFEDKLHDYDAVLDTIGGETLLRSFQVLRRGGKVVSVSGTPDGKFGLSYGVGYALSAVLCLMASRINFAAKRHGAEYEFFLMHDSGSQLREITRLIEHGAVKPVVDRVYPWEEAQQALDYNESGHAKGKVVIQVRAE